MLNVIIGFCLCLVIEVILIMAVYITCVIIDIKEELKNDNEKV